ncbi:MAG: ATPase, partial [Clostridia bacterium]|nr:ATPase [Clostridia bacterium]
MDIEQIMNEIEEKIDRCRTIPFWGKGIIDKEEILELIQEMRNKFPEEMRQAKWVKEERQRIISDAQKEAQAMIKATEEKIAA